MRCKETSGSEPPMNCRNGMVDVRTGDSSHPEMSAGGALKTGPRGARLVGGATLRQALTRNRRTCRPDAKGDGRAGNPRKAPSTDAGHRGRTARSRMEGTVMVLDRRGCGVLSRQAANR